MLGLKVHHRVCPVDRELTHGPPWFHKVDLIIFCRPAFKWLFYSEKYIYVLKGLKCQVREKGPSNWLFLITLTNSKEGYLLTCKL